MVTTPTSAIDAFHRDGFCILPELLGPDEVAALHALTRRFEDEARGLAEETNIYDFEPAHRPDDPKIRRIKKPHEIAPLYRATAEHPKLLEMATALLGPDVRLHHSKINMKSAAVGSGLEWHQDWHFIPHTNQDLAIASILLEDVDDENGPMLILPGSHTGPLLDHFHDGWFVGAIDVKAAGVDPTSAVPVTGKAGTVSFHHPLAVHGSAPNRSTRSRSVLFYEYAAADAWPLFYGVDYAEFDSRMVAGKSCFEPRMDGSYVRMPCPQKTAGAIYGIQQAVPFRYFEAAGAAE